MNEELSVTPNEWKSECCDKYDVLIAAFCGAVAGMVDIIFVGALGSVQGIADRKSRFGKIADDMADNIVKMYAKIEGWSPRLGRESNVASAIGFLERKYKVNYDQKNQVEVGGLFKVTPKNHHYKSLSHAPDTVGLFFSLLDQFTNKSSFLSNGKLIRVKTNNQEIYLEGKTFEAKLYCGFCNWIGHIMSDLAGSSGNRGKIDSGRGMGVCMPFMEIFQLCNFGKFQIGEDRQNLAMLMTRVFEAGYDLRSGAASIPVILEELMIRVLWAIKKHFYNGEKWGDCLSLHDPADLRIMLLIGNTTLCLFDVGDAAIRCGSVGGNPIVFVLHLNIPAWVRLVTLVFRELSFRFGTCVNIFADQFIRDILYHETIIEKIKVEKFYRELRFANDSMEKLIKKFAMEIEAEYQERNRSLYLMVEEKKSLKKQVEQSAELARKYDVSSDKIFTETNKLDQYINKRRNKGE